MTNNKYYGVFAILALHCVVAQAQVPANPLDYSRSTTYEYDANGQVVKQTIEPDSPASCFVTSATFDSFGNVAAKTTSKCAGATGRAAIATRTTKLSYPRVAEQAVDVGGVSKPVELPAGLAPVSSTNALGQTEARQFDPRFGQLLKSTDANGLDVVTELDDFGRVIKRTAPSGTSAVTLYCILASSGLDASSNSPNCPTPQVDEAPIDAVAFTHAEPRGTTGLKSGVYTRVYKDRLDRTLRTVTEAYDGASQPTEIVNSPVVADLVYSSTGAKSLETKPYFLNTGGTGTQDVNVGVTSFQYDALGRVTSTFTADSQGQAGTVTFGATSGGVSYGRYGALPAASSSTVYRGLELTRLNDKGQSKKEEKNAFGEVARVTDVYGAQVSYQFDAFGNTIKSVDALQNAIATSYNVRGMKMAVNDPDKGLTTFDYDPLGNEVWSQTANQRASGTQTTASFDLLQRMVSRQEPEFTTTWTFDKYADGSACTKGIGHLCEVSTSNGIQGRLFFDGYGRIASSRLDIPADGKAFATQTTYSSVTGQKVYTYYPTGARVANLYTGRGFLKGVALYTTLNLAPLPSALGESPGASVSIPSGTYLWQLNRANAAGQAEEESYYGGLTREAAFSPLDGRPSALTVGSGDATATLDHTYTWDSIGNLLGRTDNNGDGSAAVSETFGYDGLNRLRSYTVASPAIPSFARNVQLQYNALGMLLSKSDVGSYSYGASGPTAARPHALQSVSGPMSSAYTYDDNGNVITASNGKYRSLQYTSFDMPTSDSGITGADGGPVYSWLYDDKHSRFKEVRSIEGTGVRTTWSLRPDNAGGLFFESEKNVPVTPSEDNPALTTNRHYVNVDGRPIGFFTTTGDVPSLTPTQTSPTSITSAASNKLELWHTDHLGSLAATSDHAGLLTARYSYDPFGKRREADGVYDADNTLEADNSSVVNQGTDRGFTLHEHLDDVGVVHMNGRLYDPTLGLFLQADPHLTQGGNLQNLNRYAYALNNPLNAVDPTGFDVSEFFNWVSNSLNFSASNLGGGFSIGFNTNSAYGRGTNGGTLATPAPTNAGSNYDSLAGSGASVSFGSAFMDGFSQVEGNSKNVRPTAWVPGRVIGGLLESALESAVMLPDTWEVISARLGGYKPTPRGSFYKLLEATGYDVSATADAIGAGVTQALVDVKDMVVSRDYAGTSAAIGGLIVPRPKMSFGEVMNLPFLFKHERYFDDNTLHLGMFTNDRYTNKWSPDMAAMYWGGITFAELDNGKYYMASMKELGAGILEHLNKGGTVAMQLDNLTTGNLLARHELNQMANIDLSSRPGNTPLTGYTAHEFCICTGFARQNPNQILWLNEKTPVKFGW